MIKKLLIGLMLVVMCGIGVVRSDGAVVSRVVGLSSECDTLNAGCIAFPATFSAVCTSGCPEIIQPSFTDVNRMWGRTGTGVGSCTTSTNGGSTWAGCTTQAFIGGTFQGQEMYMGTADGSVVVISYDTTPTCYIRKSTDNGTSWSTKFTFADRCSGAFYESASGWCLADGRCEFQSYHSSANPSAIYVIYRSSDNGETWTRGDIATDTSNRPVGSIWDGNIGIMALTQTTITGGAYSSPGADTWSKGASAASSFGNCWGAVILSSVPYGMCSNGTVYTLRDRTGTLFKTPTFSPTPLFNVDSGGVSYAYDNNTIYTLVTSSGGATGLYVSRSAGTSFTLIASVNPGSLRGGTMWKHPINGCVYWVAGTAIRIGKVC